MSNHRHANNDAFFEPQRHPSASQFLDRRLERATAGADTRHVWRSLGASPSQTAELIAYAHNGSNDSALPRRYPLADEAFVETWQSYVDTAGRVGVLACLREHLVQLRFAVKAGISETEVYRSATRRGHFPSDGDGRSVLPLVCPESLRLFLHQTPAGRVPVLVAEERQDFEHLVQALTKRNEPWPVPPAMGACIVAGYNNWSRIGELRRRWESTPPTLRAEADWQARFAAIVRQPALYQDRFIILSAGPYSATPAASLGLGEEDWSRRSLAIRLEHECTHYFTRQVLGSMSNKVTDELVADYMGIVAAEGRYRADWLLRFLGLEDFPRYRPGARLENYRGNPPLSDGAFSVLQRAVKRAAHNLEIYDQLLRRDVRPWTDADKAQVIIHLTRLGLEGMASDIA